ncbi:MAG: glycosyltransferase family 2 protein [Acidimicrobiaceae bacterium]|nr:glycosyltransferase family 2 protein [Acidimicrobiaceae bacterium]
MELSIVLPCLDEAETVGTCVTKARQFLAASGVDGEVVVADNGSSDDSQLVAETAGARVVEAVERGYGNAVMTGVRNANGRFVVMGDADDSYDFTALAPFLDELRRGADLVMGNRFKGGIAPGAMPALHRYLGNPVLSLIGRMFFGSPVGDFHCGLRGFRRDRMLDLSLHSGGMELASEMVVRATLEGLRIVEVPTTLSVDGRSRPPHLRTWRDGWRHLRFLLLYSPRWLFLYPGILLMALGLAIGIPLALGPLRLGGVTLDVDSLVVASAAFVIGFQSVLFAALTKIYAVEEGFLPGNPRFTRLVQVASLERALLAGVLLAAVGVTGVVISVVHWGLLRFGHLDPERSLRLVIPSVAALIVSCQLSLASLFASILGIRRIRTGDDDSRLSRLGSVEVADDRPRRTTVGGG